MLNKHEKAIEMYEALKKRRAIKAKRTEQDFLAHTSANVDRIYKKNYPGMKRRGQI